jgi:FkbM family methyltransferase
MRSWRRAIPSPVRRYLRDRLYTYRSRDDPFRIGLELFDAHLPPNPVVIEAGAHVGGDTRAMARRWRKGTVHAFEPVPEIYDALVANVRDLRNVRCHDLALGAADGEAPMWLSAGASDGSSSLRPPKTHLGSHPEVTFDTVATVRAVTIDRWCAEEGVQPDLLWLDLQGGELDALRAAERVLGGVKLIHAEVSTIEEYEGCALYPEVRAWLEERGFAVVAEALPDDSPQGNVLFGRAR